jgi:lipoate---protein ligase
MRKPARRVMIPLRLIQTDLTYADLSTSLSPAIERGLEELKGPDTVVVDRFKGGSFTIGVLEDPDKSLDLEYCRRENIVVRRRQNPGGAIWGPAGGAMIIHYLNTQDPQSPFKSVRQAFEKGLPELAEVISRQFGIKARYRPLNDIEVEGRKLVATSARLENGILTFRLLINLVPTDRDILTKAIKVAPEKIQDKKIKEVGARFTCLEDEIGRSFTDDDLQNLVEGAVKKTFGSDVILKPGSLTDLEKGYQSLYQKHFTSEAWFRANSEKLRFHDRPAGSIVTEGRHKAPAGLIRVTLLVHKNTIHNLIITGDFHPSPMKVIQDLEQALRGKPLDLGLIKNELVQILDQPEVEIPGTTAEDFLSAFRMALSWNH